VEQISRPNHIACLRQCDSFTTELSRFDAYEDRKVVLGTLGHQTGAQYSVV